jgi:hypothetical protein
MQIDDDGCALTLAGERWWTLSADAGCGASSAARLASLALEA